MADQNLYIFMGRLTADPTLNHTPSKVPVCNLNVVTNRYHYNEAKEKIKGATFIKCTAWQQKAELIAKGFKKGSNIAIEGHLENESYTDKDGNERSSIVCIIDNFNYLDKRIAVDEVPEESQDADGNVSDDEIPF